MPYTTSFSPERHTLHVTPDGFLSETDRAEILSLLSDRLASEPIDNVLFDLRRLSGENDPKAELAFRERMVCCLKPFPAVRSAVVLSQDFLISSAVVLSAQENGIAMMDFRSMGEAEAWLYDED